MKKIRKKPAVVGLSAVIALTSYIYFATYEPKVLTQLPETKGTSTEETFFLPYPRDSMELSNSETDLGKQITLEAPQTPEEITNFYKNILLSKGWEVETEGAAGIFFNTVYEKGEEYIHITTSKQADKEASVVTIDMGLKT
jgi:hypothetical protein